MEQRERSVSRSPEKIRPEVGAHETHPEIARPQTIRELLRQDDKRGDVGRGFPDTIGTGAWGRALFAFGAAIAQMRHGAYGYAIPGAIETVLIYGGLTGDSKILADLGTKFPDNLRNPDLIDAAIG